MASFDLAGIGSILDFGGKIIDKIFPDKIAQESERARANLALLELTRGKDLEEIKVSLSAILAEANSADPWTSRARPSFMYVMYVMILAGIPIGILSIFHPAAATAIAVGMKAWLSAIPDELYVLFGVGYSGYTAFRGIEKIKGKA